MAIVFIPSLMQDITSGHRQVQVPGSTVRQVIENLERVHPGMKARLVENDRIRPSISVAVDGEVTPIGMLEKVGDNSEVHFIPAIAGGSLYWRAVGCHAEEVVELVGLQHRLADEASGGG